MNEFPGKMYELLKRHLDVSGSKAVLNVAVWISAGVIGLMAVLYARLVSALQEVFFHYFHISPVLTACAGPFLFVLATWLVKCFAPDAKGSGIPQVLTAIEQSSSHRGDDSFAWGSDLVSLKTAGIKILSSCVGILGGASIGREGPTVQVAAAGFSWIGNKIRRFAPHVDFQTFLVAGSAAGVAAAFNTPIAGIAFAVEELGGGALGAVRQVVMLTIIVSGVIAQGLGGNYLYFGHPAALSENVGLLMMEALLIGIIGGLLGGLFAKILAEPKITKLPTRWMARAFVAGLICALIGYFTNGDTAGSGYEVTRGILNGGNLEDVSIFFPIYKLITTILSYLSGMAGGIFSPSLSIGAGIGLSVAKILGLANFKACALLGMVAFFSGAVRAPLTAVIIVTEMTDEHLLVLPFMIAAYLAYSAGKRVMSESLYHYLARKHLEG
ncbi:MAG: chloride channel protein [Bdellovibrio sp. CG10_big_fil_rev_8_21_14_0_10_47_8]|nr:MAG: chloride channel protein [Bdellovibrio sp. CG10_big_fil_rev_8_21_14_0_10_47_8]